MVSKKKEFVYLYELPVKIAELSKTGYAHFGIDILDPGRTRVARVQLSAWKAAKPRLALECECGVKVNSGTSLKLHQEAKKHGPFAPDYFTVNNNQGPNAINASTPITLSFQANEPHRSD